MAISAVSQHGPNPQAGLRRPDRSVSLPVPDAKGVAAEMMGVPDLPPDASAMAGFREDALGGRIRAPQPHADPRLWGQASGNHVGMGRQSGYSEEDIKRWYLQQELETEGEFDPDTGERKPGIEAVNQGIAEGVSDEVVDAAEEAYERDRAAWEQVVAMSGEPGRIGRSAPEGPTPPFEPLPELTEEERKRGKEAIEKIRRDNPDVLNPESTMDAAFLPGMFAQAAEQESQGYFGGVGDIVESVFEAVPDIDPKTAIAVAMAVAAAIAAGTGVGGPLVPPLLAGGAMLSSQ